MARQATITQEHVNAICDRLRAGNITPSPRKILDVHGSGSLSTITPLFKKWEAGQVVSADAGKVTLPAALTNMMVDVIGQQLAAGKADLETKLAESEQNNADLAREGERQLAEIDGLTEQLETEQQELATVRGRLEQVDADLVTARDEAQREREGAEKARTDLAKAELRLEAMPRLEADLVAVRGELDGERAKRIVFERAAAVAEAQRVDLLDRLQEEKKRALELAAALQLAQDQAAQIQEQSQLAIARVQEQSQAANALVRQQAQEAIERVTGELTAAHQARIEAEQQAAVLAAHNEDVTARLQEGSERAEQAAAALQEERGTVKRLMDEVTTKRIAVETANAHLEAAQRQVTSAREDTASARAEAKKAFEEVAELRAAAELRAKADAAEKAAESVDGSAGGKGGPKAPKN